MPALPDPHVLFVCTGNYYRSRFAEELFNHLAPERRLDVRAGSRGLRVPESRVHNPGPISQYATAELARLGIVPRAAHREPQQLDPIDLERSKTVIALSASEHRPMVSTSFPNQIHRFEFWEVEDLHLVDSETALSLIAQRVEALLDQWRSDAHAGA